MENDSTLIEMLESLAGQTAAKPFECVGTIDEVQAVLSWHLAKETAFAELPLLRLYFDSNPHRLVGDYQLTNLLQEHNHQHFVPQQWIKLMED